MFMSVSYTLCFQKAILQRVLLLFGIILFPFGIISSVLVVVFDIFASHCTARTVPGAETFFFFFTSTIYVTASTSKVTIMLIVIIVAVFIQSPPICFQEYFCYSLCPNISFIVRHPRTAHFTRDGMWKYPEVKKLLPVILFLLVPPHRGSFSEKFQRVLTLLLLFCQ